MYIICILICIQTEEKLDHHPGHKAMKEATNTKLKKDYQNSQPLERKKINFEFKRQIKCAIKKFELKQIKIPNLISLTHSKLFSEVNSLSTFIIKERK
jgi:hypothetical protein